MSILITILLVMAGITALLLLIALFIKKEHYVKREIIINAPRQKVFDYIKLLKNQDEFNKHAMAGPDRKREFKGIDGTVGYIYAWSGNNPDNYRIGVKLRSNTHRWKSSIVKVLKEKSNL
ncbi:MAG: hypothetical protein ABIN97_19575 [Ginsengibacter sp.]